MFIVQIYGKYLINQYLFNIDSPNNKKAIKAKVFAFIREKILILNFEFEKPIFY